MDGCFKLIKKLSTGEKQYFLKENVADPSDPPLYIILYQLMEGTPSAQVYSKKRDKYNEQVIKERITSSRLFRSYSVYKNTLYEKLLMSLRHFYGKSNTGVSLDHLREEIKLLASRGLIKEAHKRIKKAKNKAQKYHRTEHLLQLLGIERELVRNYNAKNPIEVLESIQREREACLDILNHIAKVTHLYDQLYIARVNERSDKEETDRIMKELEAIEESTSQDTLQSFYLQGDLCALKNNLYRDMGDDKRAVATQEVLWNAYEAAPHMIEEMAERYIGFLNNYIQLLLSPTVDEEAKRKMPLLRGRLDSLLEREAIVFQQPHIKANILRAKYNTSITINARSGNIQKILDQVPDIEEWLDRYAEYIPVTAQLNICRNIAVVYFFSGQYNCTVDWVNKGLNLKNIRQLKPATRLQLRLLEVVAQFEIGNYGQVAFSLIFNFRKFLKKHREHPDIEPFAKDYAAFLTFLRKASISANQEERRKLFSHFYQQTKDRKAFASIQDWLRAHSEG